ncbi:lysoplasmalogenase family protein [Sphingosinithalassobacter sp. CS137]|uniref:lysoplasmalogenase family protein n=1 Tax=Sphingosinithalassobacter sp. CS137 TaxID=2762748 RepID=UPI00165EBB5F|nr:lysoplasmalogenase family protein [Sphingosinithalassobacter sp. CS137]
MQQAGRNAQLLFFAALAVGASYYANRWIGFEGVPAIVWKGGGVGLLALWAATLARRRDGWTIAAVLAFGAAGDVLLEAAGLTVGALAFLAGHLIAILLYLRHRERPLGIVALVAIAVAGTAWLLPDARAEAPGVALYALGLGAMAGAAGISRFPVIVPLGAALFVLSDLLIFARMGPLGGSELPGLLIWPTYFGGQALIAWGVVTRLRREGA